MRSNYELFQRIFRGFYGTISNYSLLRVLDTLHALGLPPLLLFFCRGFGATGFATGIDTFGSAGEPSASAPGRTGTAAGGDWNWAAVLGGRAGFGGRAWAPVRAGTWAAGGCYRTTRPWGSRAGTWAAETTDAAARAAGTWAAGRCCREAVPLPTMLCFSHSFFLPHLLQQCLSRFCSKLRNSKNSSDARYFIQSKSARIMVVTTQMHGGFLAYTRIIIFYQYVIISCMECEVMYMKSWLKIIFNVCEYWVLGTGYCINLSAEKLQSIWLRPGKQTRKSNVRTKSVARDMWIWSISLCLEKKVCPSYSWYCIYNNNATIQWIRKSHLLSRWTICSHADNILFSNHLDDSDDFFLKIEVQKIIFCQYAEKNHILSRWKKIT